MWSQVVGRGKRLRLTTLEAGTNVGMLLYNALERDERYNMPDTLKGQQVFFLTQGRCLHSDMGRILASVLRDTAGWHDTVCGCSDAEDVKAKFGERSYQEARNEWYRSGQECFLIELAKWGLDERALVPNVNWFSKVRSDEEGGLHFVPEASPAGSVVEIRFEMDVLVVLNTCQHPLDSSPTYRHGGVKLEVLEGEEMAADDECRLSHPENGRAFENTANYHRLRF
ncbi:MAG: urea amidolyase associated protein UAAP1 [Verrucomicrobiales bacterium]